MLIIRPFSISVKAYDFYNIYETLGNRNQKRICSIELMTLDVIKEVFVQIKLKRRKIIKLCYFANIVLSSGP